MLDFRTQTFLTVCEHMNYTKAAEVLSLTQPAISGHIRYLEDYYGVKLFIYENKRLSLTKHGEVLKRSLQTIYHDEVKLKRELMEIKSTSSFRIGATLSIGDAYIPAFLSYYLDEHKDLELSVTVANTSTLLKKLDQGLLDIVLTEGYFSKDEYECRQIKEEPLGMFCGQDYESENIINIEDIFAHRFISREPGSGTRAVFEHFLLDNGYSMENFRNRCEFTSLNLITQMLMANQGISVLYRCAVEPMISTGEIREIVIPGLNLKHDFNAVWQKNTMFGKENEDFTYEIIRWQDVR